MNSKGRVHLIGIGGIGMSGLARMYLSMGYEVQGSDLKKSEILSALKGMGVKVFIGHDASHVRDADWVVYSSSIGEDHPERVAAVAGSKRLLHRAEALAELCRGKFTIAVTGTHGKTTTTALIGSVLREAGRDPSIVVGGLVLSFGSNAVIGGGNEIVIEADESDSSFLRFSPDLEVITNIEEEHMDHFKNMGEMEAAYRGFVSRLPRGGEWFGCSEDPRILELAGEGIRRASLYGFERTGKGVWAAHVEECPDGRRGASFHVRRAGELLGRVATKLMGRHNVLNALAAVSVGLKLEIPFEVISRALGRYEGTARRFEVKYEDQDYLVVDDYAHHPTEVRETLAAARALKKKRVFALFQPHRYTRTGRFSREFGASFTAADKLLITEIYAAGEKPVEGVSGERLCEETRRKGHPDVNSVPRAVATERVARELRPGDLFIALGAGDVSQVAREVAQALKRRVFEGLRGKVALDEPLAKHTTLKVGGPAEFWIEPEDGEDLKKALLICRENELPFRVVGSGSNILPPDEGLKGAVIHLGSEYFREIWSEDGRVFARAGVQNTLFIQFTLEHGFGGCEFLLGIPGNIGGLIAMNAGSHGQSVDSLVESVTVLDRKGTRRMIRREEASFGYRSSGLSDFIVLEAVFTPPKCERSLAQGKLDEYREYRLATQDLHHPSAGCMFKNPRELGCSSGKLIEDAGLKGHRIGNAQVSLKHANFIINLGGASSRDIERLIEEVRFAVKKRFQVDLETEVKVLK